MGDTEKYMMQYNLQNLKHALDLIKQISKADLRTEASRGYLGVLWWIIEPVLYMGTFYIVFSHIIRSGDGNYVFFLLTGLVVWKWFNTTIIVGSNSLMVNVGLMNQVYVPKIIFPLTVIVTNTVKFFIIFILFLVFLCFASTPSLSWFSVITVIFVQTIFTISVTCLLSSIIPFFPDLRQLLDNILLVLLFLSGVFLNLSQFPERIQKILFLNPMAVIISMYRKVLLDNSLPDWNKLLFVVLFSIPIFLLAFWLLNRFDRIYPKIIH